MMIINSYRFGGYTARTQAFLTATGITDTTIANALNVMDLALIANSLDTKMNALYPFVGGTATTHKYNFMNALDTDAAFRLTFSGGWTHSSGGAKPNGSTGYANTYLIPSVTLTLDSSHLSYCSSESGNGGIIGQGSAANNYLELLTSFGAVAYSDEYGTGSAGGRITGASLTGNGFFISVRNSSTTHRLLKSNTLLSSSALAGGTLPTTYPIYIGARNDIGTPTIYQTGICTLSSIGAGLDTTAETNFYNTVTTFNTSLGR